MNTRRKLLTSLGLGALTLPTLAFGCKLSNPEIPQARVSRAKGQKKVAGALPPATQGRGGDYFPNVVVYDHNGKKYHLYDDLIRDKVVIVNFMTVKGHDAFPVTEHLVRIADRFGSQLGRDLLICSITTDPAHDTPKQLQVLARHYGADRPGWHFLTTSKNNITAVSKRLRKHGGHTGHGGGHPIRMLHYGNGSVGIWGAFGADIEPGFAVERVSWVKKGSPPGGALRRAGPRRITDRAATGHNRVV